MSDLDIEKKLREAKKGNRVYDPNTDSTYQVLATKKGEMPLTIVRSSNVEII